MKTIRKALVFLMSLLMILTACANTVPDGAETEQDAEMLQLIADTRSISFAYSYGMSFNNILSDLGSGSRETASYIKSTEKVAQKTLERMIKTFSEFDSEP